MLSVKQLLCSAKTDVASLLCPSSKIETIVGFALKGTAPLSLGTKSLSEELAHFWLPAQDKVACGFIGLLSGVVCNFPEGVVSVSLWQEGTSLHS